MGNGVLDCEYSGDGSLWWRSEGATEAEFVTIIIIFSLSSKVSATGDIFDLSIHYNIVYLYPKLSCDDALCPCHNVLS